MEIQQVFPPRRFSAIYGIMTLSPPS